MSPSSVSPSSVATGFFAVFSAITARTPPLSSSSDASGELVTQVNSCRLAVRLIRGAKTPPRRRQTGGARHRADASQRIGRYPIRRALSGAR